MEDDPFPALFADAHPLPGDAPPATERAFPRGRTAKEAPEHGQASQTTSLAGPVRVIGRFQA